MTAGSRTPIAGALHKLSRMGGDRMSRPRKRPAPERLFATETPESSRPRTTANQRPVIPGHAYLETRMIARSLTLVAVTLLCGLAATTAFAQSADPLPSWNEGPAKQSIMAFVAKVTREGSPDFVPAAERIATFDNDGTLWAEQPLYFQLFFGIDRVKALAPEHPEWKDKEPFKSVLAGDIKAALAGGAPSLLALLAAGSSNMTPDEFDRIAKAWIATARHPTTGRLYSEMVYQPMLELLAYLRANGFKTFIVSGGGVDFMRAFAEKVYGVPPEQVVGSAGQAEVRDA